MSKLAVLPNVEATPEMILAMVREQLPKIKSLFIVIENADGMWESFHHSCSVAEVFFAGAVLQRTAIKAGTGQ